MRKQIKGVNESIFARDGATSLVFFEHKMKIISSRNLAYIDCPSMYKPKEHVPNVVKLFGVYLGLAPDLDQRTTATQHFVSFFMFLCENGF